MPQPEAPHGVDLVERLAHLGFWPAGVAGALIAANGVALGAGLGDPGLLRLIVFGCCGTLVVYDVDRLRDVDRDRATAGRRVAFVEAHRAAMRGVVALAGAAAFATGVRLGATSWALCGAVLALGLLHRRMKAYRDLRVVYVSAAWVAIVAGLPALGLGGEATATAARGVGLGWIVVANASAIASNLVCSGLPGRRDGGVDAAGRARLQVARGIAILGAAATLAWAGDGWPLAAIPVAQALAALRFRSDERFRHALLDAHLLAGALTTLVGYAWATGVG